MFYKKETSNDKIENVKNKIIHNIKKNLSIKLNSVIDKLDDQIEKIKKEKVIKKGIFNSILCNYKNKDYSIFKVINSLLSISVPFSISLASLSLIIFSNNIQAIVPSMLFFVSSFVFFIINLTEADKITIAEKKILECEHIKNKIKIIIESENKKIEQIFENKSKHKTENVINIDLEQHKEEYKVFNQLVDLETFNKVKETFSKEELISLLMKVENENITYSSLINFISELENKNKAEELYQAMFSPVNEKVKIKEYA